jgi:hypothetical protein
VTGERPEEEAAMNPTRWCSGCAAVTAFERFDCADHPDDCVELVCTTCGVGIEDGREFPAA